MTDFEGLRGCHFGIFFFPRWTIFLVHALHLVGFYVEVYALHLIGFDGEVFLPLELLPVTANESVLPVLLFMYTLFKLTLAQLHESSFLIIHT